MVAFLNFFLTIPPHLYKKKTKQKNMPTQGLIYIFIYTYIYFWIYIYMYLYSTAIRGHYFARESNLPNDGDAQKVYDQVHIQMPVRTPFKFLDLLVCYMISGLDRSFKIKEKFNKIWSFVLFISNCFIHRVFPKIWYHVGRKYHSKYPLLPSIIHFLAFSPSFSLLPFSFSLCLLLSSFFFQLTM